MTSTAATVVPSSAPPAAVHIVIVGLSSPTPAALQSALQARPGAAGSWSVDTVPAAGHDRADIAVCDGAAGAGQARAAWPSATVVALVPAHDDGTASIAAMDAGAHVCVRGDHPAVVAAYLHSVARRRLIPGPR